MTNFYSTPENEVVRLFGERVVAERYRHGDVQAVVGVELEDAVGGVLVHGVDPSERLGPGGVGGNRAGARLPLIPTGDTMRPPAAQRRTTARRTTL